MRLIDWFFCSTVQLMSSILLLSKSDYESYPRDAAYLLRRVFCFRHSSASQVCAIDASSSLTHKNIGSSVCRSVCLSYVAQYRRWLTRVMEARTRDSWLADWRSKVKLGKVMSDNDAARCVSIVQPTIFVALIYIILFGYSLHKNIMLQICYKKTKMPVEI